MSTPVIPSDEHRFSRWPAVRRILVGGIKIAITGGLFWFFWKKGYLAPDAFGLLWDSPGAFLAAALLTALLVPLTSIRWYLLLRGGFEGISFRSIFLINYIGVFYNTVLPGGLGGEVFKSVFIFRLTPRFRTRAVLSVIVDRVCGLVGLLIVCAIGIFASWEKVSANLLLFSLSTLVFGGLAFCLVGVIAVHFAHLPLRFLIHKLSGRLAFVADLLVKLVDAVAHYRERMMTVFACIGLSVIIHCCSVGFLYLTAPLLGIGDGPAGDFFAALSLANFANLMPLTPGGLGVGEAAYGQLLGIFRGPQDVGSYTFQYLTLRMLWVFISLPGGLIYAFYRRET